VSPRRDLTEEEGEEEGRMALKGFMARGERGIETAEESPRPVVAAPPAPRTVSPTTSVDASSELEGRLRCKQTLRIDGYIKGEVECEKAVLVGEGARIFASIAADEVQIAGVVEGDIVARRKITLQRTAVVIGDLTTPGIVIEEGAKLKGRIVIGSDAEAAVDAAVQPEPARDAKKAQAVRKPPAVDPKPSEPPSSQPLAASA
jgi:cytoskeletal protein CcmA (bactofilin family)